MSKGQHWNLGQASRQMNKKKKQEETKNKGVSHKKGAVSKGQHWNLGQASRQMNKKKKQEETKNKGRERNKKRKGVLGF